MSTALSAKAMRRSKDLTVCTFTPLAVVFSGTGTTVTPGSSVSILINVKETSTSFEPVTEEISSDAASLDNELVVSDRSSCSLRIYETQDTGGVSTDPNAFRNYVLNSGADYFRLNYTQKRGSGTAAFQGDYLRGACQIQGSGKGAQFCSLQGLPCDIGTLPMVTIT